MNEEIKSLVIRYISRALANICLEYNVVLIQSTLSYLNDNKWLYSEKRISIECNVYIKIEAKAIDERITDSLKSIAAELLKQSLMNPCYLIAYHLKGINKNRTNDWYCCRLTVVSIKHRDAFVMLQHPTQKIVDLLFDYFEIYSKQIQFVVIHKMPQDNHIIHVVDMKDTPLSTYFSGSEIHCGYVPYEFYKTFEQLTVKLKNYKSIYTNNLIFIQYTSKVFVPEMRLDENGTVPNDFSIDSLVLNFIVSIPKSTTITVQ